MVLDSSRLGKIACEASDLLVFPDGLIGFEHLHAWVLLREGSLHWLQAFEDPQIALPAVSPFDYVIDYRLLLQRDDSNSLELSPEQTIVLTVVAQHERRWTLNLRAPILIQPEERLGRQVVASGEYPLQYVLPSTVGTLRKSA